MWSSFPVSPVVDNIFIHDSNILKNYVNSSEILKNILSNEQHESITKKTIKLEKGKKPHFGSRWVK